MKDQLVQKLHKFARKVKGPLKGIVDICRRFSLMSEIGIYQTDNETRVEVRFEGDTVWLTQRQVGQLFQSSKANISEHVKHIFEDHELNYRQTVQTEGKKQVSRELEHYNLDLIISIGYRVNSKQGIQFRQWATQRLREHLVMGYTINQKRLEQLQQTIQLVEKSGKTENLSLTEAKGLLEIISGYTQSFVLLNRFDSHGLKAEDLNENITYEINYKEAVSAIRELKKQLIRKKEAGDLFGNQKDDRFAGVLGGIVQTFGGEYLTEASKSRRRTFCIL